MRPLSSQGARFIDAESERTMRSYSFLLTVLCCSLNVFVAGCRRDVRPQPPSARALSGRSQEQQACDAALPSKEQIAAAAKEKKKPEQLFQEAVELADKSHHNDADARLVQAMALRIHADGAQSPSLVPLLLGLAVTAFVQGNADEARNQLLCARGLLDKAPQTRENKSHLVDVEHLLGSLENDQQHAELAIPHLERARKLLLQLKEPSGWRMASIDLTYANALAADPKQLPKARLYFEQSLSAFQAGKYEDDVAAAETSFGLFLADTHDPRDHERSEKLLLDSVARYERLRGVDSGFLIAPLSNLVLLRLRRYEITSALDLAWRILAVSERRLRNEAPALPRTRLLSLLDLLRRDEENLYSVLADFPELAVPWWRLGMAVAILRQGRALDIQSEQVRLEHMELAPEERAKVDALYAARLAYQARATYYSPGKVSTGDLVQELQPFTKRIAELEQELARREGPLIQPGLLIKSEEVVDKMQSALPPNSAFVSIVAYRKRDLMSTNREQSYLEHYLAFVLTSAGQLIAKDLGAVSAIDKDVNNLQVALGDPKSDPVPVARRVYDAIIRPLAPILAGSSKWFLALDGWLTMLPFWALHDGRDYLLASNIEIGYVNSGRDLLRPLGAGHVDAALFANPAYDLNATPDPACTRRAGVGSFVKDDASQRCTSAFSSLSGSEQEAKEVKNLLGCDCLRIGTDATRKALLSVRGPGILLISTHGFLLNQKGIVPSGARGTRWLEEKFVAPSQLLLHAGLAMAGANQYARRLSKDGLVTDLDVQSMDLRGTQLAVLSACQTGLGAIYMGQGVYGLQRATLTAGAETVVTSLWFVDDAATKTLITRYFQGLMSGQGRVQALQQAARSVREDPLKRHPYYWAPFISIGQAGPLRGFPTLSNR